MCCVQKKLFFSSKHLKTNQVWNLTDFDLTNSINLVIRHPGINMNSRQNLENACLLKLFAAKHTFLPTSRLTVGAGEIVGHENWKYSVQPTPAPASTAPAVFTLIILQLVSWYKNPVVCESAPHVPVEGCEGIRTTAALHHDDCIAGTNWLPHCVLQQK